MPATFFESAHRSLFKDIIIHADISTFWAFIHFKAKRRGWELNPDILSETGLANLRLTIGPPRLEIESKKDFK